MRKALEQPAQEIVRKVFDIDNFHSSVLDRIKFTSPQQWQGLSDDEINDIKTKAIIGANGMSVEQLLGLIVSLTEQAIKEKNPNLSGH